MTYCDPAVLAMYCNRTNCMPCEQARFHNRLRDDTPTMGGASGDDLHSDETCLHKAGHHTPNCIGGIKEKAVADERARILAGIKKMRRECDLDVHSCVCDQSVQDLITNEK